MFDQLFIVYSTAGENILMNILIFMQKQNWQQKSMVKSQVLDLRFIFPLIIQILSMVIISILILPFLRALLKILFALSHSLNMQRLEWYPY
jgi:uncharacterized integral membrane protein